MRSVTIEPIVEQGLCNSCGTCFSACPKNAIELVRSNRTHTFYPRIRLNECSNCGLCYRVCPGGVFDFNQSNINIFGRLPPESKEGILLGNHINCYSGYSTNDQVRFNSSSGGLVSELLIFMLEERIIDGALVTRMNPENPLEPESFIARTPEEISLSSGSKYCPVSANVALKEILDHRGKYAVVGLPCHIQGVRKAEEVFKVLRNRVILHLGLFCTHNDSFLETDFILHHLGIDRQDVSAISYRGKGWPGNLRVRTKTGKEFSIRFEDWVDFHTYCFFSQNRCLLCCDQSAEFADVSFGDAWLPQFLNDKIGTSIAISRTEGAEKILREAVSEGRIKLDPLPASDVVRSQGMMRFKKNSFVVRSLLLKSLGTKIPQYNVRLPSPGLIDWPRSGMILFNRLFASPEYWGMLSGMTKLQKGLEKLYARFLPYA